MPGQGATAHSQATAHGEGESARSQGWRWRGEVTPRPLSRADVIRAPHIAGTRRANPLPKEAELLWAVRSLYNDKLKPCSRMLKLRLAERPKHNGKLKHCDAGRLRSLCERSSKLQVELLGTNDWAVFLRNYVQDFVDVYSEVDCYPEEVWQAAVNYFGSLAEGPSLVLPRGRYASAQALMARQLPFLRGFALGQVCHFVQIAISKRKLLGYIDGGIVPYAHSISMAKSLCAQQQCPLPVVSGTTDDTERAGLPIADWDVARATLREILAESASHQGPPQVQLSNVKRLFRSLYQMELSETALGYTTLTELLHDPRFQSICEVRVQGRGHVVVPVSLQVSPTKNDRSPQDAGGRPSQQRRVPEHAICANEVEPKVAHVAWPASPDEKRRWSSFPASPLLDVRLPPEDQPERSCSDGVVAVFHISSQISSTSADHLPQTPRCQVFCPDEPLCLEDAEYPSSMLPAPSSCILDTPSPLLQYNNGFAGHEAPDSFFMDTPSPQLQYTNNGLAGYEAFERTAWEATCPTLGSDDDGTGATSSDAHEESIIQGEPFELRTPSPLYDRSACWAWIQEQEGRDASSPPISFERLLLAEGLADCCSPEMPSTSRTSYETSSNSSSHGTLEATSGSSIGALPETEASETIVLELASMV